MRDVERARLRRQLAITLRALRKIKRVCEPIPPRAPEGTDVFAWATGVAAGTAMGGIIRGRWRFANPRSEQWGEKGDDDG